MIPTVRVAAVAAILVSLPSCGSSSPPAGAKGSAPASTPEAVAAAAPYRVAGVGLMMTEEKAAAALVLAGYRKDADGVAAAVWTQLSFEDQVRERITGKSVADPRKIPTNERWRKDRETVELGYAAYPGGARVTGVTYKIDGPAPSDAEMRASLEKRYGPGRSEYGQERWCAPSPCKPESVSLQVGVRSIGLAGPDVLTRQGYLNRRLEEAAHAEIGTRKGSY